MGVRVVSSPDIPSISYLTEVFRTQFILIVVYLSMVRGVSTCLGGARGLVFLHCKGEMEFIIISIPAIAFL